MKLKAAKESHGGSENRKAVGKNHLWLPCDHVSKATVQQTVNELNKVRETYNAVLEQVKALPALDSEEAAH